MAPPIPRILPVPECSGSPIEEKQNIKIGVILLDPILAVFKF